MDSKIKAALSASYLSKERFDFINLSRKTTSYSDLRGLRSAYLRGQPVSCRRKEYLAIRWWSISSSTYFVFELMSKGLSRNSFSTSLSIYLMDTAWLDSNTGICSTSRGRIYLVTSRLSKNLLLIAWQQFNPRMKVFIYSGCSICLVYWSFLSQLITFLYPFQICWLSCKA